MVRKIPKVSTLLNNIVLCSSVLLSLQGLISSLNFNFESLALVEEDLIEPSISPVFVPKTCYSSGSKVSIFIGLIPFVNSFFIITTGLIFSMKFSIKVFVPVEEVSVRKSVLSNLCIKGIIIHRIKSFYLNWLISTFNVSFFKQ